MEKKYLIATTKVPSDETGFVENVAGYAESLGLTLTAVKGSPGPGCYNMAFKVSPAEETNAGNAEERCEEFAKNLAMALMPSRYCDCGDEFSGFNFTY